MSLSVCVCNPVAHEPSFRKLFDPLLKKVKNIVFGATVADFVHVKKQNEQIALFVSPTNARDVIKYLCDDYANKERRVKFIYSCSVGVDSYYFHEMAQEVNNIKIYNARGCFTTSLKEHVLLSMLYFNRQCWRLNTSKALKKWDQFNMVRLMGQKLVIVGYGDIGQGCGKAAAMMGMKVIGIRRTPPTKEFDENGVRLMPESAIFEAISDADFVLGVLPLSDKTRKFFNKDFFSHMKPTAVFINIGRGSTQCEQALMEAIEQGAIRGAALDVFDVEPLPQSSPLWSLPDDKLLLTAHCADVYEEMHHDYTERFIKIIEAYIHNKPIDEYAVNINQGY